MRECYFQIDMLWELEKSNYAVPQPFDQQFNFEIIPLHSIFKFFYLPLLYRCNVAFDNSTLYPNLTEEEIQALSPADSCSRYVFNTSCTSTNVSQCINMNATESCLDGYHYNRSLFTETVITQVISWYFVNCIFYLPLVLVLYWFYEVSGPRTT